MKTFKEYLTESKKTYSFKVKVAGDLSEDFSNKLKTAMDRFSVVKLTNGKRVPIAETPLDFPNLRNINVTIFEVEVSYPTTREVLENYISQVCGCPAGHVRVLGANDPQDLYKEAEVSEKESLDDTLLATEDLGGESGQESVGQTRVLGLLKELDKVNADRKANTVKTVSKPGKEMSDPVFEGPKDGTVSPVGSKAVKRK